MKLTLSNVKEIKRNSNSPLTKRVCNYVIASYFFTMHIHQSYLSRILSV